MLCSIGSIDVFVILLPSIGCMQLVTLAPIKTESPDALFVPGRVLLISEHVG